MAKARWLSSNTLRKSPVLKITHWKMAFLSTKTLWKSDKVDMFFEIIEFLKVFLVFKKGRYAPLRDILYVSISGDMVNDSPAGMADAFTVTFSN